MRLCNAHNNVMITYMKLDNIYCISLASETIRRNFMTKQLGDIFGNYVMIDAYDHNYSEIDDHIAKLQDIKATQLYNVKARSQFAISLSHIEAVKQIYNNRYTCAGIIEDDIRIDSTRIHNILNTQIFGNPDIVKAFETQPAIIHMVHTVKTGKCGIIKMDHSIIGTCFTLMNWQMAEIIINNFTPIRWQYDTYIYYVCQEHNNIAEYICNPIVGWDISSTYYVKYWSPEDKAMHQSIKRLSKIGIIA